MKDILTQQADIFNIPDNDKLLSTEKEYHLTATEKVSFIVTTLNMYVLPDSPILTNTARMTEAKILQL